MSTCDVFLVNRFCIARAQQRQNDAIAQQLGGAVVSQEEEVKSVVRRMWRLDRGPSIRE